MDPIEVTICAGTACVVMDGSQLALLEEHLDWFERIVRGPVLGYASAMALILVCLEIFGVIDASIPFIYFQF